MYERQEQLIRRRSTILLLVALAVCLVTTQAIPHPARAAQRDWRAFSVQLPITVEGPAVGYQYLSPPTPVDPGPSVGLVLCGGISPGITTVDGASEPDLSRWFLNCHSRAPRPGQMTERVQGTLLVFRPDRSVSEITVDLTLQLNFPAGIAVKAGTVQRIGPVFWKESCSVAGRNITLAARFKAVKKIYPSGNTEMIETFKRIKAKGPVRPKSLDYREHGTAPNQKVFLVARDRKGQRVRCQIPFLNPLAQEPATQSGR